MPRNAILIDFFPSSGNFWITERFLNTLCNFSRANRISIGNNGLLVFDQSHEPPDPFLFFFRKLVVLSELNGKSILILVVGYLYQEGFECILAALKYIRSD